MFDPNWCVPFATMARAARAGHVMCRPTVFWRYRAIACGVFGVGVREAEPATAVRVATTTAAAAATKRTAAARLPGVRRRGVFLVILLLVFSPALVGTGLWPLGARPSRPIL
jgi:hypothetical protein